jgi:hypothetical protein
MNNVVVPSAEVSFEWDQRNQRLEIHGNREGLRLFADCLKALSGGDANQHIHFMTTEWGGTGLSTKKQNETALLINHVKVFLWLDAVGESPNEGNKGAKGIKGVTNR